MLETLVRYNHVLNVRRLGVYSEWQNDKDIAALAGLRSIEHLSMFDISRSHFELLASKLPLISLGVSAKGESAIWQSLGLLTRLERLEFDGPLEALPEQLAVLKQLKSLDITVDSLRGLSALPGLQSLTLRKCSRNESGAQELSGLKLESLAFEDAAITAALPKLASLRDVRMRGCPEVVHAFFASLGALPALRSLELTGSTSFVPDTLEDKQAFAVLERVSIATYAELDEVTWDVLLAAPKLGEVILESDSIRVWATAAAKRKRLPRTTIGRWVNIRKFNFRAMLGGIDGLKDLLIEANIDEARARTGRVAVSPV